jgi:multiple RNA-binding domain-containing protein 1
LVEYSHSNEAKGAFKNLAYSRFKNLPLYLEWAPNNSFITASAADSVGKSGAARALLSDGKTAVDDEKPKSASTSATLFVKNLNFSTTLDRLTQLFSPISGFVHARIAEKTHKGGEKVSMGFGYVYV